MISIIIVVLLLVGGLATWYFMTRNSESTGVAGVAQVRVRKPAAEGDTFKPSDTQISPGTILLMDASEKIIKIMKPGNTWSGNGVTRLEGVSPGSYKYTYIDSDTKTVKSEQGRIPGNLHRYIKGDIQTFEMDVDNSLGA